MKIKDVMTKSVETVRPDQTLQEAASKMKSLDVGPMPVTENDRLVGMLTDRDIVVRAAAEGKDVRTTKVRDAMTAEVVCVASTRSIEDCMALMTERRVRHLPVIENGQIIGLVSIGDLVKATIDEQEFTINQLKNYIAG